MAVELYDEHEQSERVRGWLRENGGSIVLGVVLALAAIFGWRQWEGYRNDQKILADQYRSAVQNELAVGNLEQALAQFRAMRDAVGSQGHVPLAALAVAAALNEEDRIDEAAEVLTGVLEQDRWPALQPLLRLRLALLETARGNGEAALARLAGDAPQGYEGLWAETRGDVLLDLGRLDEAALAYQAAVDRLRAAERDFRQAEVKLQRVRSVAGTGESA
ncbi:MAG: tetratricopeptide repeat protein [Wenzhouxiangellaceae bacterium]|nr:tetratricopeptide repeat protein [Wenzhouxiangellaceae bacterium]